VLSRIARARLGSVATFAALALAAALVDLGHLHRLEHGDSIVPVLVSLQRWTPFYWDQERYGMLVPLLVWPVRDPLWNLLLQRGLLILAGLAAVVLLARHVLAGRDWRVAGAIAAAFLLVAWPAPWLFEYLGDQPYGLSLALALAGLAWAEPVEGRRGGARAAAGAGGPSKRRIAAGLALVVLAHWVNAAAGVVLLPLAVARAAADRADGVAPAAVRSRLIVDAGLLASGLAAGQVLLRLAPIISRATVRVELAPVPVAQWPAAWGAFLGRAWAESGGWMIGAAALAAAGLGLLLLPGFRPLQRGALLRAGALAVAGVAYALFTGTLPWVRDNAFHWRYLAPAAVLLLVAAASLVAEPLARFARAGRWVLVAAVTAVPAAALLAAGAPSLTRVRADLDAVAGGHTEDVLAARCDLVAGDYWTVWPTVWHATWTARARGVGRPIHGITHRASPTAFDWWDRPRETLRICRPHGAERDAERWLGLFHLWPAEVVERRPTLDVLVPTSAPPGGG
jgi:hypothetical protein